MTFILFCLFGVDFYLLMRIAFYLELTKQQPATIKEVCQFQLPPKERREMRFVLGFSIFFALIFLHGSFEEGFNFGFNLGSAFFIILLTPVLLALFNRMSWLNIFLHSIARSGRQ